MPPNQQVMGGCNQIISLRFGFPNSFPLILSTDHSLALKKGDRREAGGGLKRGNSGGKKTTTGQTWTTERKEERGYDRRIEELRGVAGGWVVVFFFSQGDLAEAVYLGPAHTHSLYDSLSEYLL